MESPLHLQQKLGKSACWEVGECWEVGDKLVRITRKRIYFKRKSIQVISIGQKKNHQQEEILKSRECLNLAKGLLLSWPSFTASFWAITAAGSWPDWIVWMNVLLTSLLEITDKTCIDLMTALLWGSMRARKASRAVRILFRDRWVRSSQVCQG